MISNTYAAPTPRPLTDDEHNKISALCQAFMDAGLLSKDHSQSVGTTWVEVTGVGTESFRMPVYRSR